MFTTFMEHLREEVKACRAAQLEERCRLRPCSTRLGALEARERLAMQRLILAQMWWGPYFAVANLWWAGDGRPEEHREKAPTGHVEPRSTSPELLAAE